MRSCTVLIRQRQRDTWGLVPRALALPEAAGHMRSCTCLAWLALSANGRRVRVVEFLLLSVSAFLLPIVPSPLQRPHIQAIEFLLPLDSLLLQQPDVQAVEFLLPIDSLLQQQK